MRGQGILERKLDMHALPPSAHAEIPSLEVTVLGGGALGRDQGSSLDAVRGLLPGRGAIQDSGNGHSPDTEGACSLTLNSLASEL